MGLYLKIYKFKSIKRTFFIFDHIIDYSLNNLFPKDYLKILNNGDAAVDVVKILYRIVRHWLEGNLCDGVFKKKNIFLIREYCGYKISYGFFIFLENGGQ